MFLVIDCLAVVKAYMFEGKICIAKLVGHAVVNSLSQEIRHLVSLSVVDLKSVAYWNGQLSSTLEWPDNGESDLLQAPAMCLAQSSSSSCTSA